MGSKVRWKIGWLFPFPMGLPLCAELLRGVHLLRDAMQFSFEPGSAPTRMVLLVKFCIMHVIICHKLRFNAAAASDMCIGLLSRYACFLFDKVVHQQVSGAT